MPIDDRDRYWIGPDDPEKHTAYRMQSPMMEQRWLATPDGTELDPDYSEFSVRIYDPHFLTLNFINKTIAILPKSRLRSIYFLLQEYLNEADEGMVDEEAIAADMECCCQFCADWDECDTDPHESCDEWREDAST